MLQIPVSSFDKNEKVVPPPAKKTALQTSDYCKLRQDLLQQLEKVSSAKEGCELLEKWAQTLAVEPAEELQPDCVLLLAHFKKLVEQERLTHELEVLKKEKEGLIAVALKAVSADDLEQYLGAQLKRITSKLKAAYFSKKEIENQLAALRFEVISGAYLQALKEDNLPLACAIFMRLKNELPSELALREKIKISGLFTAHQAQELWQQACQLFPYSFTAAVQWAQQHNEEPNLVLHQQIDALLDGYKNSAWKEQQMLQAAFLQTLAKAPAQESLQLLNQTVLLSGDLLTQCHQACMNLDKLPEKPDAALLVKLYFSGEEKSLLQAYQNGHITAREWLLVRAQLLLRTCGITDFPVLIRCKELEISLRKKGFSETQIARFQRELMVANNPDETWAYFQKLFNQ